jgi:hypothetical protein
MDKMKYLFFMSVWILSSMYCQSKSTKYKIQKMNYEQVIAVIDSITDARNLLALESLMSELTKNHINDTSFCPILLHACDRLSSVDFGDYKKQAALESQYALLAIDKVQKTTNLTIKLGFAEHLFYNDVFLGHTTNEQLWTEIRKRKVDYALDVFHELYLQIDQDFDFKDIPIMGSYLSLDSLDTIEKSKVIKKVDEYNLQVKLKNLNTTYAPKIAHYIKEVYRIKPENKNELLSLLDKYRLNSQWKNDVINWTK